jgi:putative transcriptional regulator
MAKSRLLNEVHATAKGLQDIGVVSEITMREFDRLCLTPVHPLTPHEIQTLRKRAKVSQAVFAAYLNTSPSTVQKWEIGEKTPSGMALKLLNLIEQKGLAAVAL